MVKFCSFCSFTYHEALYSVKALGELTSGLSVVDSEAGAERPENVRKSPLPACISRHALLGLVDCPYTQTASGLRKIPQVASCFLGLNAHGANCTCGTWTCKNQENTGGICKSQENPGGYLRSGDDLKKLENSSSRREVHMYAISF